MRNTSFAVSILSCLGVALGLSATWSFENDHTPRLSSQSLSDLRYTRVLYNSTDGVKAACGIIAFNSVSFNGTHDECFSCMVSLPRSLRLQELS